MKEKKKFLQFLLLSWLICHGHNELSTEKDEFLNMFGPVLGLDPANTTDIDLQILSPFNRSIFFRSYFKARQSSVCEKQLAGPRVPFWVSKWSTTLKYIIFVIIIKEVNPGVFHLPDNYWYLNCSLWDRVHYIGRLYTQHVKYYYLKAFSVGAFKSYDYGKTSAFHKLPAFHFIDYLTFFIIYWYIMLKHYWILSEYRREIYFISNVGWQENYF